MNQVQPFGSWPSTLSASVVARAGVRLGAIFAQGTTTWWWEGRPAEAGRGVIVVDGPSGRVDLTPAPANVRSRVHEYDGGSWTVLSDQTVAYVEAVDQHIHLVSPDGTTRQLTSHTDDTRYGNLTDGGEVIFAVRERHSTSADGQHHAEPVNDLVAIERSSGAVHVVASGHDFFSSPRPHPSAPLVAYICWDHPNMPWDDTELHVVEWSIERLGDNAATNDRTIVAGLSTQQPLWRGDDLVVITDPSGWWVPCQVSVDTGAVLPLVDVDAEFGAPPWVFGTSTLVIDGDDLVAIQQVEGLEQLVRISAGEVRDIPSGRIEFGDIALAGPGQIVVAAARFDTTAEVVRIDTAGPDAGGETVIRSASTALAPNDVSTPRHIEFGEGNQRAYALFYPPHSAQVVGPEDELPPLLVLSHGGPPAAARAGLNLSIQYWTQRGYGVVDINYRGSTGYGRAFRDALHDMWGIADVDDCIAAAEHLAEVGLVDGDRLLIKGGSAGGYTTLSALTFRDVFRAGASRYGIGDLEMLARDTHKFESRYLDLLVGPYPERADIYRARSPIHHVEQLSTPMIVLQGSIDPVVPPNQAFDMVNALDRQQVPHAFLLFDGESHGFRDADNIVTALEGEYTFFCRVLGIEPSGELGPLEIKHLAS